MFSRTNMYALNCSCIRRRVARPLGRRPRARGEDRVGRGGLRHGERARAAAAARAARGLERYLKRRHAVSISYSLQETGARASPRLLSSCSTHVESIRVARISVYMFMSLLHYARVFEASCHSRFFTHLFIISLSCFEFTSCCIVFLLLLPLSTHSHAYRNMYLQHKER